MGLISKDQKSGSFAESFLSILQQDSNLQVEDVSSGVAEVLSIKFQKEQELTKNAAQVSSIVLKNHLIPLIEDIIQEEKQVTHSKISLECEELLSSPEKIKELLPKGLHADEVDCCYAPIIMSGGKYDLRPSASSNSDKLKYDTIVVSLGARYHSYCSNISRTLFINASSEQEKAYRLLTKVHHVAIQACVPGAKVSDIYKAALAVIQSKDPEKESNFVKNCGFGVRHCCCPSHGLDWS